MSEPELSVVVPTFNERDNVEPLIREISTALGGTAWEALFVDDSTDGTDAAIAALAADDARVRLRHRTANRGGLSGAVVEGFREARGTYICVLDADLQHPPSLIPALLAEARRWTADVVIASRYIPGGSAGGLGSPARWFYSRWLGLLSKGLFPGRLRGISDPLGGFFLVRRSIVTGAPLRPVGYKILLEVLVRCRWRTAREVPYCFAPRRHGESKADMRQGLRFLRHLTGLAWDCSPLLTPARRLNGALRGASGPAANETLTGDEG